MELEVPSDPTDGVLEVVPTKANDPTDETEEIRNLTGLGDDFVVNTTPVPMEGSR